MKILHLLEATHGGTRRHVLDLLPALQRRGFECALIYSSLRHAAFERDALWLREQGIEAWPLPMARGWGGRVDARAVRELARVFKTWRPAVVHCHSSKAGLLGRLARVSGTQSTLVYTPHCVAFDTGLPRGQRRAAFWIEKLLAPRTDAFIAVSRHEARALKRIAAPSRIHTIFNGLDFDAFDALSTHHAPLATHSFTIGCFGRLTMQKNQAALMRAMPIIRREIPAARLWLVGAGEMQSTLSALAARLKISDGIDWAGDVSEARPLYARCDVVVQPSRWEGCPYSILEAMAARRAIVASPVGGVPEVLDDAAAPAGLLCRASPRALAASIIALAQDKTWREELGEGARERAAKYFVLDEMVEKTSALYGATRLSR